MSDKYSFYWHDYETFSLNTRTGRPAQFAGMRTDLDMNPLKEDDGTMGPDIWYCRPSDEYLPDPDSCMVTGITPQVTIENGGMIEKDFARKIRSRFTRPGTIGIGYNNIHFDDEVTRFLFWRNMYDAYEREWKDGCSRWDLYPFVLAVWALRGKEINWPMRELVQGKPPAFSFRLENLTKANNLSHEHAHDAASDVMATIALAKLLKEKEPKLWKWAFENRSKEKVAQNLESGIPAVWIDPTVGQKMGYMRFVRKIAFSFDNKNEILVWDCRHKPDILLELSAEDIARRAFGLASEMLPGEKRLPIHSIKINTAPFVCGNIKVVNAESAKRFDVKLDMVKRNAEDLDKIMNATLEEKIARARQISLGMYKDATAGSTDCDGALYEGFPSRNDKRRLEEISELDGEQLADMAGNDDAKDLFEDQRLNTLLLRYRARNWPETLSDNEAQQWLDYCKERFEGKVRGIESLEDYRNNLLKRREEMEKKIQIIDDLLEWSKEAENSIG